MGMLSQAVAMAGDGREENKGTGSNQHEQKPAPGAGISDSKEAGRQQQHPNRRPD